MRLTALMRIATDTGQLVFHRGLIVRSTIAIRALQLTAALFSAIYLLLGARLILTYVGADRSTDFARLIWASTEALYTPFPPVRWLSVGDDGAGHPLEWSLIVAIAAYAVVHVLIRKMVLFLARPPR